MQTGLVRGVAAVAGVLWLAAPIVAYADDPFALDDRIIDRVGALGDRRDEVEEAIDRLFQDHRLDLSVVYVDDFSGWAREAWADETAVRSQLGINDALLAVATGERVYQLLVHPDYPLTDEQLAEVESVAIEPALRENDWAGTAIGGATGLSAVLASRQVQPPEIIPGDPEPSAGSGFPWVPVLLAGAGVAGVGAYAYPRSRRRRSASTDPDS